MSEASTQPIRPIDEASRQRGLEMQHLQLIEGNPLTADEIAMFDMFEREGWSHERRRAYILATVKLVPAAATVRTLAEQHGVTYSPTATNAWAHHVTRLAGDDVQLDEIEQLLIALQRAGHLRRSDALGLQVRYLREAKP